ncbi:MAG: hypothetical protein NC319_02445 [Butyricicoccus sp.]|nr:hypothetical protein [Butyricicoccus sp.]
MGSALNDLILAAIIFAAVLFVLVYAGLALVKREVITKETMKRAIISIVVFAIIYWGSGFVIGWREYNVYIKAIEFLSAVIGAGCYWTGSNKP